jgi:hypothetical protein
MDDDGLGIPFDVHFVRYRREGCGLTLAWCSCGWAMRGDTDTVYAASAAHDLDPHRAAMAEEGT